MPRRIFTDKKSGFIALISVLVMAAVLLMISLGISWRSTSESIISLGEEFSNQAFSLANSCAEYALLRLKSDLNYSGNETIIIEGDSACDILPLEGVGGANRVIKTESTVQGYKKKIRVDVAQVGPPVQISFWQEVADF